MPDGSLCLVLHAHLPFVRHPEHEDFLEEDWLFQAINEAYVPVWSRLLRLAEEGVRFALTMTVSPTLAAMLDDPLLRKRLHRYLDRLRRLAQHQADRHGDALQGHAARLVVQQCNDTEAFVSRFKDDLLAPLRQLQNAGHLEIATCNGTHGLLPLMSTTAGRRAQIRAGVDAHARNFGRRPRGMWLAECGYEHGLDERLSEAELEFFFAEATAIERGRPPSPMGLYAPVKTSFGLAVFARDHETGEQVWSADHGYPGHPAYREFHRDFGLEAAWHDIEAFLPSDGRRRALGLKFHRVTGRLVPLGEKAFYDPRAAELQAREHARQFVEARRKQVHDLAGKLDQTPVITACYDAELFGHWWYEGPVFLEEVLRLLAQDDAVLASTVTGVLDAGFELPRQNIAPTTWGAESSNKVWLNPETTWVYPLLHQAEARMQQLARKHANDDGLIGRAMKQLGRELLLAQSSDWTFLITLGTAPEYGAARVREHINAFNQLADAVQGDTLREGDLRAREARTPLFPDLDVSAWV